MNALEVLGLGKVYGGLAAVDGVSFTVRRGEVFALVGPNGAGKSTTLKMLATILTATSGAARVFGLDLRDDAEAVRRRISYLPEEAGAYRNLAGDDYLRFMADISLDDAGAREEAFAFGSRLSGLGERLRERIKTYSKGMTRKLLLARTVMNRPGLAILDEPTSGLDVLNAFEIRRAVRALAAEGMTFLVSSHNMLEVEFISDRVAIMNRGRILACDTPSALKEAHRARNLEDVFVELAR
ncbi:MAG: ABC transporter ATP-binding protein [Elusimicrobia bacterium]|nr:ABC transporter ATP-binding protein [Elusimicrobiota bacterium]